MKNKTYKSTKLLSEQRPDGLSPARSEKSADQPNQTNNTQTNSTNTPPKTTTKPTTTTPKSVTPGLTGKSTAGINTNLIKDLNSAAIDMQMSLYLSSTLRPTDSDSRHKSGNAVDIAAINGYTYNEPEFKRLGDQLMNYLVKQKGYTHNIEQGKPKSVLWYMPAGGDSSKQHRDHLHVSNMTGVTSKTEPAVKYYYKSLDDNNWSSFFTKTKNGTDLTINATSQLTSYLNSYTSKNIDTELVENRKVYNYYSFLKVILEKNPDTYFSKYRSWNPLVGGDDEEGAAAAFDKLVPVLYNKLNIDGDNLKKYHIASMNMATLIDHVQPHIKELIETGDQGVVTFNFILINTADTTKINIKTYEITWNYM